jgi:hypothetical protein
MQLAAFVGPASAKIKEKEKSPDRLRNNAPLGYWHPLEGDMRIACLGWGSLVWDSRELPIRREWFKDGPFAPVEFTRQSQDGRITLVIDSVASPVRLLWALMVPTDIPTAKEALRVRECLTSKDWSSQIGTWQQKERAPAKMLDLPAWAVARGLDAVIWTALGPKFKGYGENESPPAKKVIEYLRELVGPCRNSAKQYIERAPRQIDTDYRRQIEAALGWSCKDSGDAY